MEYSEQSDSESNRFLKSEKYLSLEEVLHNAPSTLVRKSTESLYDFSHEEMNVGYVYPSIATPLQRIPIISSLIDASARNQLETYSLFASELLYYGITSPKYERDT